MVHKHGSGDKPIAVRTLECCCIFKDDLKILEFENLCLKLNHLISHLVLTQILKLLKVISVDFITFQSLIKTRN
jgi:hypothetical protein